MLSYSAACPPEVPPGATAPFPSRLVSATGQEAVSDMTE